MNNWKQNASELQPVALVLGDGQCALGTIRSLKDDPQIPIILLGDTKRGIAHFSKYLKEFYHCEENDSEGIYKVLKKINEKYEAVIPIPTGSDFWVNIIIESPVEFDHFITDLRADYQDLMKKSVQQNLAETCQIPYPDSVAIHSVDNMKTACNTLRFPIVVKPVSRASGQVPFRIRDYKTPSEFIRDIKPLLGECDFLASTQITGPDKNILSYGSFSVDGEVKAEFTGRKLTQRPMRFGVAGIAEAIRPINKMSELSKKLLKEIRFSGISQIEFKKDSRDGKYYLMEINPRIWLWVQTATRSGVNLVLAYYWHLSGQKTVTGKQKRKVMFINGASMFDNTFREKNLTWIPHYLRSRITRKVFSIKDRQDPKPYKVERSRFLKKFIYKTKNIT